MNNIQFATSIRAIADFYERHPEMPQFHTQIFTHSAQELISAIQLLRSDGETGSILPSWSTFIGVGRDFDGLRLEVLCSRNDAATPSVRVTPPIDPALMAVLTEGVTVLV